MVVTCKWCVSDLVVVVSDGGGGLLPWTIQARSAGGGLSGQASLGKLKPEGHERERDLDGVNEMVRGSRRSGGGLSEQRSRKGAGGEAERGDPV